jgi:hypothetical protein
MGALFVATIDFYRQKTKTPKIKSILLGVLGLTWRLGV